MSDKITVLDSIGLETLCQKIKTYFVAKDGAKVLSTNDYTTAEKNKLAGIAENANAYTHPNTVTAGTVGTSSATSGSTLAVPYVTYNANGHITATGTHTHTISGFLTAHQTIKQNGVTGATGNCYGACSTAAGTAAKTVSVTAGTPTLEAGLKVTVKFANANTAGTPTLNVNSLGVKNIFHKGAKITTGDDKSLLAGVCDFVYDGTQFHLVGNYINTDTKVNVTLGTTTKAYLLATSTAPTSTATGVTAIGDTGVYLGTTAGELVAAKFTGPLTGDVTGNCSGSSGSCSGNAATATSAGKLTTGRAIDGVTFDGSAAITHYGTCGTAAGTAAKVVACTSYTLVTGSRIIVKFTVTNTAANPTLNVNSTGAKAIQYRGAAITAGNLAANRTYEFIYDGSAYQLVGDIDTVYTHPTGAGNNHIPSGGSSGQILTWSSAGTAAWANAPASGATLKIYS